mgnify:CR=1 FL=1
MVVQRRHAQAVPAGGGQQRSAALPPSQEAPSPRPLRPITCSCSQRAEPLDGSPQAAHTAAVVNEVSDCIRQVLEGHAVNAQRVAEGKPPANVVLLRGCGCRLALQV